MIKYFLSLVVAIIFLVLFPFTLKAQGEAGSSAELKMNQANTVKFDYRKYILRKFLVKHGSPLVPYSDNFVRTADFYGLDYRMVPAISGVESTFGKRIPYNSYNAYGWAGGNYRFESWPDSIEVVSKALRKNYIDRGANSITEIAKIYAPPSKTWGKNVNFFVKRINPLPLGFDI